MKYAKYIKWVLAILFVVGIVFSLFGYFVDFNASSVNNLLFCAYAFALVTILAVLFGVVVIGGINNPKSLLKILLALVVIAALIGTAYLLAPGTPAVGYLGTPVSDGTLMLTDTVLNLAYFLFGGSMLALVAGWIIGATRK